MFIDALGGVIFSNSAERREGIGNQTARPNAQAD